MLPLKNALLVEAKKYKTTGTKFIVTDTAGQLEEHKEKQFVSLRQRCTPGEKGCGRPFSEEERKADVVASCV